MATTTIPWSDGSGDNIYLTYPSASGDQTVQVSSDANTGDARTKTVVFTTGGITKQLVVNQEAGGVVTDLPYIRNTSTSAYIDTGITADDSVKIVIWARNFNPTSGFLFGSRNAALSSELSLNSPSTQGQNIGRLYFGYGGAQSPCGNQLYNKFSSYHKYEIDGNVIKVDDEVLYTASSASFSNNHNIHLFGVNNGGAHTDTSLPMDIFAAKIYKGGVLVRDFVARNTPAIGLYDYVSQTLFTNSGSGSFTFGRFDPASYTPLQYISCTAGQYFDSGVRATKSMRAVCAFRIVGTSQSTPTIIGTMTSGTAGTYFVLQAGNASYKNRYLNVYIDGSSGKSVYNNNSTKLTGLDVVFFKNTSTTAALFRNHSSIGTSRTMTISNNFQTPDTIGIGANKKPNLWDTPFYGYLRYIGLEAERSFVPVEVNDVAGMYDTYNDVFYPSISGTDFIAGPEL